MEHLHQGSLGLARRVQKYGTNSRPASAGAFRIDASTLASPREARTLGHEHADPTLRKPGRIREPVRRNVEVDLQVTSLGQRPVMHLPVEIENDSGDLGVGALKLGYARAIDSRGIDRHPLSRNAVDGCREIEHQPWRIGQAKASVG